VFLTDTHVRGATRHGVVADGSYPGRGRTGDGRRSEASVGPNDVSDMQTIICKMAIN